MVIDLALHAAPAHPKPPNQHRGADWDLFWAFSVLTATSSYLVARSSIVLLLAMTSPPPRVEQMTKHERWTRANSEDWRWPQIVEWWRVTERGRQRRCSKDSRARRLLSQAKAKRATPSIKRFFGPSHRPREKGSTFPD